MAVQYNGAPKSVYDPYNDGDGSDPSARARWAAWEHPNGEDAIYVSWHSNACGTGNDCAARGTVVYTYDDTECAQPAVDGSFELAAVLQEEIVDMAKLLWDPEWKDRGTNSACFAENSSSHNPEMPAALIELAFHNNAVDVEYLKEPSFRRDSSRAMYRAIVRYFAERDGDPPHFLPEPPVAVSLRNTAAGLEAAWSPGPKDPPYGDAAQSYMLFLSQDGLSWDNGTPVSGTSAVVDAEPYETVHVRVVAVNEGGRSFPSDVVSARRSPDGKAPILIVDAFDRFDAGLLDAVTFSGSLGTLVRMDVLRMNPADTASVMARAVDSVGWPYDSVTGDAFAVLSLDGYRALIWSAGEESTIDETFSDSEQSKVRAFVEAGGALWASGAEILWDLDAKGSSSDKAFATDVLGATLASDDAATEAVSGEGILEGLALDFGPDDGASYPVEFPDVLASDGSVIARYSTNGIAAAIHGSVALFGFPFEAIGSEAVRQEVASRLLEVLVTDYVPPTEGSGDTAADVDTDENASPDTDEVPVDTGESGGGPGLRVIPEGQGCGCATGASGAMQVGAPGVVAALLGLWSARRRTRAGFRR
jgi:hypothetical protein